LKIPTKFKETNRETETEGLQNSHSLQTKEGMAVVQDGWDWVPSIWFAIHSRGDWKRKKKGKWRIERVWSFTL